jgi:MerR family transcriptional regulator, heat shock protein HspR
MARRAGNDQAIYIISVAAELAGVHPQTLRVYERKGLVTPKRTQGNTRRYSERDIELLRRIQELTQEGINLAGVMRILELEDELEHLRESYLRTTRDLEDLENQVAEALGARDHMALVPFKEVRRIRRAMKSDDLEQVGKRRVFPAGPIAR